MDILFFLTGCLGLAETIDLFCGKDFLIFISDSIDPKKYNLKKVYACLLYTSQRINQSFHDFIIHNCFHTVIERTYKLEETEAVMQEQIRVANHRIADLEKQMEG